MSHQPLLLVRIVYPLIFFATTFSQSGVATAQNPLFPPPTFYDLTGLETRGVVVADVNKDGKPDLVLANWFGQGNSRNGTIGVLVGDGDGTIQSPVLYDAGGDASGRPGDWRSRM